MREWAADLVDGLNRSDGFALDDDRHAQNGARDETGDAIHLGREQRMRLRIMNQDRLALLDDGPHNPFARLQGIVYVPLPLAPERLAKDELPRFFVHQDERAGLDVQEFADAAHRNGQHIFQVERGGDGARDVVQHRQVFAACLRDLVKPRALDGCAHLVPNRRQQVQDSCVHLAPAGHEQRPNDVVAATQRHARRIMRRAPGAGDQ